jgi:copper chaperone CopZ
MRILSILALSFLFYTPAALACGGQPCGDSCKMGDAPAAPIDLSGVEGARASFSVSGMKCGKCSTKVLAAINAVEGVKGSAVDHAAGKAEVVFDAAKTNNADLLKVINATGFAATLDPQGE